MSRFPADDVIEMPVKGQLVIHSDAAAATSEPAPPSQKSVFTAPTQKKDDSATTFGDQWVPPVGSTKYSSYPSNTQNYTPINASDARDYEAWINATQLHDRRQFQQHDAWQERLKKLGQLSFSPTVTIDNIPIDQPSTQFKTAILQQYLATDVRHLKLMSFLGRTTPPDNFSGLPTYTPVIFSEHEGAAAAASTNWDSNFDEIKSMIEKANTDEKLKASSMTIGSHRIPPNKFMVVCDHNGQPDGTKIQIWTGLKQSFTMASKNFGQNLNKMIGTEEYDINVDYLDLPNSTIVRIYPNEIGFCYNPTNKQVEKMASGRYLLQKGCQFIGRASLQYDATTPTPVKNFSYAPKNEFCDKLAAQLSVLFVQPNHVAFIQSKEGVFALSHRPEPYIIDQRNGFSFISSTTRNQQICTTTEASPNYFIVTLQPGEFIIFKDHTTQLVWEYDDQHPELNTVHLSSIYFAFNGRIYNNTTPHATVDQVTVFCKRADQFVVLKDDAQNVRFLEDSGNHPITLRAPWRYVASVPKAHIDYHVGQDGEMVHRIQSSESQWIAVVTREGKFELIPPPLDGSLYYFYQPTFTVVGIVNINQPGEQHFDIPRIGKVSIVNLSTGQIGCCMINNANFLLNPAPRAYVFVPPNRFFGSVSVNESHIQAGDVHRIYIKPDERCVVEKNGKAILLPDAVGELENDDQQSAHGVYTFRAERLKIDGPKNKSEKEYRIGPYHFFTVNVGEIGYGSKNGTVFIWEQGEHRVDVNKNERFTGFFSINVDPVQIERFQITSKHGITSHVNIYVGYSIRNPDLTIRRFKSHEELHKFIEETTRSMVLQLCAKQPPIGYTDSDFTTGQMSKPVDRKNEGMEEIESEFTRHASELLRANGVEIGTMHITKWDIDPEFMDKARTLALGLQQNRADLERAQINLQQQQVQNAASALEAEQKQRAAVIAAQTQAEIEAAKITASTKASAAIAIAEAEKQAKIAEAQAAAALATKRTEFETNAARAASETKISEEGIRNAEAKNKIAAVERQGKMDTVRADAEQKSELAVLAARQQKDTAVLNAETEAFAKTAGKRAEAKAGEEVAEAELNAAKMQAEKMRLLAEAKAAIIKLEGEASAAVIRAETDARYPSATGDALIALEIAKLQAATQQAVAGSLHVTQHTMTDAETRKVLHEQLAAVQATRNVYGLNNPITMFASVGGRTVAGNVNATDLTVA